MDLANTYARSAYPALGISLERATTEPALRKTLELAHWMQECEQRRTAKRAERIAAGTWIEKTNEEDAQ